MKALVQKWNQFFTEDKERLLIDIGLLLLRLGVGLMMAFSHGMGKLQKFFAGGTIRFADPIGLGMSTSLFLAGAAEFVCALAIAVGLMTRAMAVPLAFTMIVAAFIVHGGDPFRKQEFALLYLIPCITLMLSGPGRFSIDAILRKRLSSTEE